YELGEKGKWSKAGSLFEEGARTPFSIYVPKGKSNGKTSPRVVEALDFYPTLCELAGLPIPKGQEGRSLVPLLNDPTMAWDHPAFTLWSEDGTTFTGISVRDEHFRYAEYTLGGALLLDMDNDPHELKNLADDPKYAAVKDRMSKLLAEY